jgi:integrase/recombinase XerD
MTALKVKTLAEDIEAFLKFKRGLGYPYVRGEFTLRSFLRFAQQQRSGKRATNHSKIVFEQTLDAWLSRTKGRKPVTVATDLGVIRQLCLFRRRRDPNAFVPDYALAPQTESDYSPYIFSREEVKLLLHAARRHHGKNIWAAMLHTLLLVLYCTGLRFGEAVRLRLFDVDLTQCTFLIRESKGRTRLVPFGKDLAHEISTYLNDRMQIAKVTKFVDEDALFIRLDGTPLTVKIASGAVRRLLRKMGMKSAKGRTGPRPYDLRHTFAVHRLTEWYHQGVDIHARLPWLSAYMGHLNVLGTEVYLHATEELLQLASQRFENRFKHTRRRR